VPIGLTGAEGSFSLPAGLHVPVLNREAFNLVRTLGRHTVITRSALTGVFRAVSAPGGVNVEHARRDDPDGMRRRALHRARGVRMTLVIGGRSKIGAALIGDLVARGEQLRALVRP
jgi:hypothetical protein